MQNTRKILLSVLIVGALGSIVALGAFSAFSSTTSNSGNSFAAGTVDIGDNDTNSAMYQLTNQKPGVTTDRCIKVTYTGSLDSAVKLYSSAVGAGSQYVDLTVTRGSGGSFPSCAGFTPAGGPALYSGTLQDFSVTHSDYSNGLAAPGPSAATWSANDEVVYRFSVGVQDDNNAKGINIGAHSFTWEAQNT